MKCNTKSCLAYAMRERCLIYIIYSNASCIATFIHKATKITDDDYMRIKKQLLYSYPFVINMLANSVIVNKRTKRIILTMLVFLFHFGMCLRFSFQNENRFL